MDVVMIHRSDLDAVIQQAAIRGAELALLKMPKQRPAQYNMQKAAEELGCHRHTIRKMLDAGALHLNSCGKIPAEEIERVIAARSFA